MSILIREVRNRGKLFDAGDIIISKFVPVFLRNQARGELALRLSKLNLQESEELIRELKAILNS